MILRLSNYEDLFAYAKCHKTCYSKYILTKNVSAKIKLRNASSSPKKVTLFDDTTSSYSVENLGQDIYASNICNLTDNQILHRADEILQKAISEYKTKRKFYPCLIEITIKEFESHVPSVLLTFTKWLLKSFECDEKNNNNYFVLSNIIMCFYCKKI